MTATLFNTGQTINNAKLDQLTSTTNVGLDNIMASVNSELTVPLRLTLDGTNARKILIGSNSIANPETGVKRSALPVKNIIPSFSSGSITFPTTDDNSNAVISPGTNVVMPTIGDGNYLKVGIGVDDSGNILLSFGVPGASESAATTPKLLSPKAVDCGYVVLSATSGSINVMTNGSIHQYSGGGAGGGGLIVTPITVSGTTPSTVDLESGKHYIVDMSTATGDVNLNAPAGDAQLNFKVSAMRNWDNAYRVTITANGSDRFYYSGDSTSYDSVRIFNPDSWIEFAYLTTNVWIMNSDENAGSGGGLVTEPKGAVDFDAEAGKWYLVDMDGAAANKTITLPEGVAKAVVQVSVKNNPYPTYSLIVQGFNSGSEKIWYNDTANDNVVFPYDEMTAVFAWDTNDNHWIVSVSNVPISGTLSGSLDMTGTLKVDKIQEHTSTKGVAIQGKTDGVAVAAGMVGQLFGSTAAFPGAFTAKDTSGTNWAGGGGAQIWSRTFNKGVYLVMAWSKADLTGTAGGYMYFRVNGAQFYDFARTSGVTGWQTLSLFTVFNVDTDSTVIDITAVYGAGSNSASTEVTIVRIA